MMPQGWNVIVHLTGGDALVAALRAVRSADTNSAYRVFLDGLIQSAQKTVPSGGT